MVNTNIIVGPNYLGHITADVIKKYQGFKYGINSNIWDDLHRKGSMTVIKM